MKRLLLDVNVVLDVLEDRKPHAAASGLVWAAIERGSGKGLLAAHGLTTIHYLMARDRGARVARQAVEDMLRVFGVAAVDDAVIRTALGLSCRDFEDAVAAAAAHVAGCDAIVTRDVAGFRSSPVPAIEPRTAVAWLAAEGG